MIRPYIPSDIPQLEKCYIELQDFERKLDSTKQKGQDIAAKYIQDLVDDKTGDLIIAETDNKVIGFIFCYPEQDIDLIAPYMYITDLVVLPEYRGQGFARSLIGYVIELAHSRKLHSVKLNVLYANANAVNFYEEYGFERYELVLKLDVPN